LLVLELGKRFVSNVAGRNGDQIGRNRNGLYRGAVGRALPMSMRTWL
jgi:hypothetical protein